MIISGNNYQNEDWLKYAEETDILNIILFNTIV